MDCLHWGKVVIFIFKTFFLDIEGVIFTKFLNKILMSSFIFHLKNIFEMLYLFLMEFLILFSCEKLENCHFWILPFCQVSLNPNNLRTFTLVPSIKISYFQNSPLCFYSFITMILRTLIRKLFLEKISTQRFLPWST